MKKPQFLTGNMLKLLAAFSMLLDHAGLLFFPSEMGLETQQIPVNSYEVHTHCQSVS